jgi:hypothetical protein
MVALYVNSRIVCGIFLSWLGGPPQSFEHSIWDHVGFYTIHTFLDLSDESQFRIISKSYNFLFGTTTTPSLIVTSSQVRVGTPLPLLSCCISGLGPEGLRQVQNNLEIVQFKSGLTHGKQLSSLTKM